MSDFTRYQYNHESCPELACSIEFPANWELIDTPDEPASFSNPFDFHAFAVAHSTTGQCVVTLQARPAHDQGSVQSWVEAFCLVSGLSITEMRFIDIGGAMAIDADVARLNDARPIGARMVYLEDGSRLYSLLVLGAKDDLAMEKETIDKIVASLRIQEPRGATAPFSEPVGLAA